ncbi:unnamed protein product [Arctia plantaginis]|uniref:Acyl-CoA dehydrogenase/oxidase C-terminal domain-containing protein n=1 Tax=Arctia plantaginis TaxID=874455 RepID=A0A8S1BI01_ARCPL|nr:unnamed protein product [Arctia plantaginis]
MVLALKLHAWHGLRAAWRVDHGQKNTRGPRQWLSATPRKFANKAAADAVQILAAMDSKTEYPVEKLMRDAKITRFMKATSPKPKGHHFPGSSSTAAKSTN